METTATLKPCAAEGCQSPAAPNRRLCYFHKYAAEKARDPVRVAWHRLTSRARARGIFCDLGLEDFREFAIECEVMTNRGRFAQSFTVDRIIEELGYTRGNLQRLTNRDNVLKEHARRKALKWVSLFDYYGDTRVEIDPETGKQRVPGRLVVLDECANDEPSEAVEFETPPF